MVTSHGVGMAVPDWPNTYGYNMFFFPVSKWVGGVFYEHSHRLVGSAVGLLVLILALWLHGPRSRSWLMSGGLILLVAGALVCALARAKWQDGLFLLLVGAVAFPASFIWPKSEPAPKWMRRMGIIALVAVIFQGVLGGLRVTMFKDELGIFHGTLAQLFFLFICLMALFLSRWWQTLPQGAVTDRVGLRWFYFAATGRIFLQLMLGATMRHQHAGLAISDFPLAYGELWPDMSTEAVAKYNQNRVETTAYYEITAFQIGLQMAHRILAALIFVAVLVCVWLTRRELGWQNPLSKLTTLWMTLIVTQVFLGAVTIWTNKSADIATAHVAVGALSLMTGGLITTLSLRRLCNASKTYSLQAAAFAQPSASK